MDGTTFIELPVDDDLDEVGRILMRAADIVDERWRRGFRKNTDNSRCVLEAILEADGKPVFSFVGRQTVCTNFTDAQTHPAAIRLSHMVGDRLLWRWNDSPNRTAAEVSAAMRAAARAR